MTSLPESSFHEIAANMREIADQGARSIELARSQPWAQGPGTQAELAALATDVRIAGQLAELFAHLVPHEEVCRDFFAGLLEAVVDFGTEAERRRA